MLKEERVRAEISQRRLSDESGVPLRTVQYWEQGHADRAIVGELKKVADVLGCKVDDLI